MADKWHYSIDEADSLPIPAEIPAPLILQDEQTVVLWYAPKGVDEQPPHDQAELYVVGRGSGYFERDGEKVSINAGDLLYVPANMDHRFIDFSDDFGVWVVFYGDKVPAD